MQGGPPRARIVPFEIIESLTGRDFLRHLPDPIETAIEQVDGREIRADHNLNRLGRI